MTTLATTHEDRTPQAVNALLRIRQAVKQLSAAAACAQIDMAAMKKIGNGSMPHDDSPIVALDRLAVQLSAQPLADCDAVLLALGFVPNE